MKNMKTLIAPASLLLSLVLALTPSIASAQFNSNEGNDPFKRAATGDTSGLLNLINQAQINGKTNPNYANEQREQVTSATEDFRALQLKALRDHQKKADPATAVAPK
jgi:hypothetical protein